MTDEIISTEANIVIGKKPVENRSKQFAGTPGLKIDLGCGNAKRDGFVGLDYVAAPGVDYVINLTNERLPFEDNTVDHVFSAHFLEHIGAPNHIFKEIARVCRDGAKIEFWTPYAFTNDAFLYGHVTFFTEQQWLYFCYYDRDYHIDLLGGRWLLRNINYVVSTQVESELSNKGISVDFALRYFKSVATEFGVEIDFTRDLKVPAVMPIRTYSHSRYGERFVLSEQGLNSIQQLCGSDKEDEPIKTQTESLPVFSAVLPSALTGKSMDTGGKVNIDGLNKNKMDTIVNVKNEDGFDINGWAFDDKTNTPPETIFIELAPVKDGDNYYVAAKRSKREDLAVTFDNPALKNAAFMLKADIKMVPSGEYEINIIQIANGNPFRAATGGKITKTN